MVDKPVRFDKSCQEHVPVVITNVVLKMNDLSALISRKEQLLKRKEALIRRKEPEIEDDKNSDIIEDSETEITPKTGTTSHHSQHNIILYSTDDEPSDNSINTSTISLPMNHSFFKTLSDDVTAAPYNTNVPSSVDNSKYDIESEAPQTEYGKYSNIQNDPPFIESIGCKKTTETENANKICIISDVIIKHPDKAEIDSASRLISDAENNIESESPALKTHTATELDMGYIKPCSSKEVIPTEIVANTNRTNIITSNDHNIIRRLNKQRRDDEPQSESDEICESASCSYLKDTAHNLLTKINSNEESTSSIFTTPTTSHRGKRKANRFKRAYMDYKLEEDLDDFSCGSSDYWSPKETDIDSSSERKKRAKKRPKRNETELEHNIPVKRIKKDNKNKNRKLSKTKGLSYETISGTVKEPKKMKTNPCIENKCPRKCYEIPEERRQALFDFFWSLDDRRKKEWIVQCAVQISIKRKRTDSPMSKREKTIEYYINEGEGRRQVCQKFIRHTLDVSQTFMLYNIANSSEGISKPDNRTRHAVNKYDEDTQNLAKKYIEELPVLPSHYNRPESNRLYLSQDFKCVSNLYRLYMKYCEDKQATYLSERLFRNLFEEYNITFHVPKKDKCKLCVKYENNTNVLNEQETNKYQNHLEEKKACYRRNEIHRNLCNDNSSVLASFDLQKVLNTPHGKSMLLYYSRKYAVYNLTVYESNSQNGFCYTWGESDGNRGSCEVGTCLYKYLLDLDKRGIKYVVLYCDSCSGQNKNKVVLTMLKYFLENAKNVKSVQINYLLPGHTYMAVDSMHSVIEREVRNLIVWSPVQWPTFMLTARKSPRPYIVNALDHTDFINWEDLAKEVFSSKTTSNPQLRLIDVRIVTFKKPDVNEMEVKYTMKDDGEVYKIRLGQETTQVTGKGKGKGKGQSNLRIRAETQTSYTLPKLYTQRLPISTKKYKDLKKLCDEEVIPKSFVQDYLQLPYEDKVDYLDDITQSNDTNDGDIEEQSGKVNGAKPKNQRKKATKTEHTLTAEEKKTERKPKTRTGAKITTQKGEKKQEKGKIVKAIKKSKK